MWRLDWWEREFVSNFDKYIRFNPMEDLETYMNQVT